MLSITASRLLIVHRARVLFCGSASRHTGVRLLCCVSPWLLTRVGGYAHRLATPHLCQVALGGGGLADRVGLSGCVSAPGIFLGHF